MSKSAKALWMNDPSTNTDKVHVTVFSDGMLTTYWGRKSASLQSKSKQEPFEMFGKTVDSKLKKGYENISDKALLWSLADQMSAEHSKILKSSYGI